MIISHRVPSTLTVFDTTVHLIEENIPIPKTNQAMHQCDEVAFFLSIPNVVRFLALPHENRIIIEKAQDDTPLHVINTWLFGTVMAYILQYHGYLVLHGSAMMINKHAVIFSGPSGAGKSTLAHAFKQQGYSFITDDLVVIKKNAQNQFSILPGPSQCKLWEDSMSYFKHDIHHALPVTLKSNKYVVPIDEPSETSIIPIRAFYELNKAEASSAFHVEQLTPTQSLQTIMRNAYRFFMIKALGKLPVFLNDCTRLSQTIEVHKLHRTSHFSDLSDMISHIQGEQGDRA